MPDSAPPHKVLITGVAGFLGSHLSIELLRRGSVVTGLVMPGEDVSRLASLCDQIELLTGDLTDLESLKQIVAESEADIIFHLAAESSPAKSYRRPLGFFRTNVLGTLNLLEALRYGGCRQRLVFLSSAEVYGAVDSSALPLDESAPLRPLNPYAASKAAGHYHLQQYAMHFGLPAVEIRPFNIIGPGQGLGFVLPDFASQVAEIIAGMREPRIEVGRLTDERDFLDVRDAASAIAELAEEGVLGEAYHVCSGSATAVQRLLDILIAEAGVEIEVVQDPSRLRPTRMPALWGSHEKLRVLTGWRPGIPLERTVHDTLKYWLEKVGGGADPD